MSLDIVLRDNKKSTKVGTGIFIRENGKNRELTLEEAKQRYLIMIYHFMNLKMMHYILTI